jgi:hypothetical protein
MRHHDDGSPALVSFLLGGLTGAAIATLLLPRSALEARRAWLGPRPGDDRPPSDPERGVPEPALGTGAPAVSEA